MKHIAENRESEPSLSPFPSSLAPSWRRAFSIAEVVVAVGLISLLGSLGLQRRPPATFLQYRSAMADVAGTLRTMRLVAMHSRRTYAVRLDAALRRVQVVWLRPGAGEQVVRTIWLPEGLAIREAPAQVLITPTAVEPASIVIDAPRYERAFRLHTGEAVDLHEEPGA